MKLTSMRVSHAAEPPAQYLKDRFNFGSDKTPSVGGLEFRRLGAGWEALVIYESALRLGVGLNWPVTIHG